MADLFGAPIGILASDENIRQNALAGLQAQKLFGEIAQQPAELELKQAHARLFGAEASVKEQAARDAAELNRVAAEVQARRSLSGQAAAQGRLATIADLPRNGSALAQSQASPVEEFLAVARDRGIPETRLVPLAKEASLIRQQEAATANSQAEQAVRQIKAQRERFGLIGQLAGAAATSPIAWADAVMDPAKAALLPKELLGMPYEVAKDHLAGISQASIEADKRAELEMKRVQDEAHRKLWKAEEGKMGAQIKVLGARADILKETLAAEKKAGGKFSAEYADIKRADAENKRSLLAARDAKAFPPAPLDPELRQPDKLYTNAKGQRAIWRKNGDVSGWEPYGSPAPSASLDTSSVDDTEGED